jgi:hypothetical protein
MPLRTSAVCHQHLNMVQRYLKATVRLVVGRCKSVDIDPDDLIGRGKLLRDFDRPRTFSGPQIKDRPRISDLAHEISVHEQFESIVLAVHNTDFPVTKNVSVDTPKIATLTSAENNPPQKLEMTMATKAVWGRLRNSIPKRSNSTFQAPNRPSLPPRSR